MAGFSCFCNNSENDERKARFVSTDEKVGEPLTIPSNVVRVPTDAFRYPEALLPVAEDFGSWFLSLCLSLSPQPNLKVKKMPPSLRGRPPNFRPSTLSIPH